MEMQWRQDEEKCANELLQTQLDEIQVQSVETKIYLQAQEKLNTHIHVCVYAEGFTAKQDPGKVWATVSPYR